MEFNLKNKRFVKHKVKSCNQHTVNDLENIKVTLLNYTPHKTLKQYIPELVTATWNENIQEFRDTISKKDVNTIMKLFYEGKLIPTALKSVQITILLEGITTHDVTHLLRHSGLSFAADCTGDKYIVNRNLVVPSFLDDAPDEYKQRYLELTYQSHKLYDDICNNLTDKVHIQDARLVLPRSLETFYYITGSLFDFLKFLEQRIDMQVQPKSDNIIALRIYQALKKVYPININIERRNHFYCNESEHELSSKWYEPLPQNETLYTLTMETVYGDMTKMFGYNSYIKVKNEILEEIKNEKSSYWYWRCFKYLSKYSN